MMHRPWDFGQLDEWLPRNLRLCWGGDGDGGGGFGGDGGGFGDATTGGGDWGSAGSTGDFSGMDAGGIGAWGGTAYDASTAGTGMGAGGDWGSFAATNYASFDAPNPSFADIGGPNPGVSTGGGDWGSAGAASFAGTGGGYGGAMSALAGVGGGPFGDYGGNYGGDYSGSGGGTYGGGQQGSGGSFGGFGTSGGAGTAGSGRGGGGFAANPYADDTGPAGRGESEVSSPYSDDTGPAGRGESEVSSPYADDTGPTGRGEQEGPENAPAAVETSEETPSETFGEPASSETQQEAGPSSITGPVGGRDATPDEAPAGPSSFGPESLAEGMQALSGLTQSALAPSDVNWGAVFEGAAPTSPSEAYQQGTEALSGLTQTGLAPADVNWGAVFEAPSDPGYQQDDRGGPMGPIADPGWFESLISDIPGVTAPAWAQDAGKSLYDVGTWLSPQNQSPITFPSLDPRGWVDAQSPVGMPGHQAYAGPLAGPDVVGDRSAARDTFDSRYGLDPSTDTTNWAEVFEAPAQAPDYAAVFEAPEQAPDWAAVFEGTPSSPDWTSVFEGAPSVDPNSQTAPTVDVTSPSYDTTMESGPAGEPTTSDNAATKGSDPALSGYAADPGAAGQPAPGAPGATPGTPGTPGTPAPGAPGATPATAPQAGGPTLVSETAIGNVVNAIDIAAQNVEASSQVADAVSQAAHNAMLGLANPAEVAAAVNEAALANGATPAQAEALSTVAANAAMAQTAFTPGQPGQQQQAPPGPDQSGAPQGQQAPSQTSAPTPGPQTQAPSLIDQARQDAPSVPMPSARPADAPLGVPMPQARPADAPQPQSPTTTRYGPFVGTIDKGTEEQAKAAGEAADAGMGRVVAPNPNTGMPSVNALDVRGGRDRTSPPTTIVTHFTGGQGYTIGSLAGQMARGGAGYNYAVDKNGKVYQLRPDDRTAGHVGPGKGNTGGIKNANSIGVAAIAENESDLTPAQIAAMKDVVAALGRTFGISPSNVFGHAVVSPGRRGGGEGSTVSGWAHGLAGWRDAPTSRPPADIPVRTARGGIGIGSDRSDVPWQTAEVQPDIARPPADIPPQETALPPPTMPLAPDPRPVDRPLADIPAPAPFLTPPARGPADPAMLARTIAGVQQMVLKGGKGEAPIGLQTSKDEAIARGSKGREALIAAGIPAAMARAAITDTANKIATAMGYYPGGPNATVLGFSILGKVQSGIAEGVAQAMQGYQPKSGEVQGPYGFQPDAPGKRSEAPGGRTMQAAAPSLLQLVAGGRDVGAPPATLEPGQLPGRAEDEPSLPGQPLGSNLLDPFSYPIDPRSGELSGQVFAPERDRGGRVFDPDISRMQQQEQDLYQQQMDPRGQRGASLFDFLQNFNPISTAEARGRSQPSQLMAPRADPGTIQSRLSSARSNVISELQTNQGLRNTLDLVVTGEVGSQGKAAVLGFLETAMNKIAAEAAAQGRAPTGRDLLNYLNDRGYFPDTWGKIDRGKITGGALTDDLLGALAAGSNTTKGSTGNSSAKSESSRFGGNPTNATIGKEHYGVESYAHHAAWYNALGALEAGRGIGSDYAADPAADMPAAAVAPVPTMPMRGLAKGGHVDKNEPVVVGEEGPEYFMPDRPGTVFPHMPQPGKGKNVDRWPKIPAVNYPGRYGGVEREYERQTREAQNPLPSLMDLVDSGRLQLPNWHAMLADPRLIQLGRSRMDDRREGLDPGAEQYGAFIPAPAPAAEPPDPANPMAQALGYGSIRRPLRMGRQVY